MAGAEFKSSTNVTIDLIKTQIKCRATTGNVREVQKISVLINTLNEEQNIRNCPFYIVLSAIICGYPL